MRIQAANLGKGFLDLYDPNEFVAMGRALKVLNAVRYFEIGIPITYLQCVLSLVLSPLPPLFPFSSLPLSDVMLMSICTDINTPPPRTSYPA